MDVTSVLLLLFLCLLCGLNRYLCNLNEGVDIAKGFRESMWKQMPFLKLDKTMNNKSTFAVTFSMSSGQIGNRLSRYFDAIACCDIARHHFVSSFHNVLNETFFNYLPTVIFHQDPVESGESSARFFYRTCPAMFPYPHAKPGAWNQRPKLIANILNSAIGKYFPSAATDQANMSDFSDFAGPINTSLPFIPDVAVLFRCKDISTHDAYGFIPFSVYKHLIVGRPRSIYILSEPLNYLSTSNHTGDQIAVENCIHITRSLVEYLAKIFPETFIGLRRGFAFESMAALSKAKVVICPPSTFCLWPAIANPGKVFFFPGKVVGFQPFLTESFYWVEYPPILRFGNILRLQKESYVNISFSLSSTEYFNESLLDFQNFYPIPFTSIHIVRY